MKDDSVEQLVDLLRKIPGLSKKPGRDSLLVGMKFADSLDRDPDGKHNDLLLIVDQLNKMEDPSVLLQLIVNAQARCGGVNLANDLEAFKPKVGVPDKPARRRYRSFCNPSEFDVEALFRRLSEMIFHTHNGWIAAVVQFDSERLMENVSERLQAAWPTHYSCDGRPVSVVPRRVIGPNHDENIVVTQLVSDVKRRLVGKDVVVCVTSPIATKVRTVLVGLHDAFATHSESRLVILACVPADCNLALGIEELPPPSFNTHSFRDWAVRVLEAFEFDPAYAKEWERHMKTECMVPEEADLPPELVYPYLHMMSDYLQARPDFDSFKSMVEKRAKLYV